MAAAQYRKLLRMTARAFYAGPCPPKHYLMMDDDMPARSKLAQVDTSGLGVVLLDYLAAREWVPEAKIAEDVHVHPKLIRKALKFLEHEHLLMSEHRRETRRSEKKDVVRAVVAAQKQAEQEDSQAQQEEEEEDERPQKQLTFSYWCIDYGRFYDALQLRLHMMRKVIKDELDSKEVVQRYVCETSYCRKEYTSFDANFLVRADGNMHCELCDGLVNAIMASGQAGDDVERKRRRERLKALLSALETQLARISELSVQLRAAPPPYYGTLKEWALEQQARDRQAGGGPAGGNAGGSRPGGGGHGGPGGPGGGRGPAGVHELVGGGQRNYMAENEVLVTLAGAPGASGAAPAAGAAAASGSRAAGAPSSVQPFFLQTGVGGGMPGIAPAAAALTNTKPQFIDSLGGDKAKSAWGDQFLATVQQQPQAQYQQVSPEIQPSAKRIKLEDGTAAAVQKEELTQEQPSAAADDVEWEDV